MKLTSRHRAHLVYKSRTGEQADSEAPRAVQAAIAALVDKSPIIVSHVAYKPTDQSTWSIWAVTADALAHAEVKFDAIHYQLSQEDLIDEAKERLNPRSVTAWIRPLETITSFSFSALQYNHETEEILIGGLVLGFEDGSTWTVPGAPNDHFLTVVRPGAK